MCAPQGLLNLSPHQEPYFPTIYNQVFHPNVCHVCKSMDQNNVTVCNWCRMISYCSEQHKSLDRQNHIDICTIITVMINEDSEWYIRSSDDPGWSQAQKNLSRKVEIMLKRPLQPYEMQMFLFAKSCIKCHRRANLHSCKGCLSISHCPDHSGVSAHDCTQLARCLRLDIMFHDRTIFQTINKRLKFTLFPGQTQQLNDMVSFCNEYYHEGRQHDYSNCNDYILTDYVSDPLTLHNGLRRTKLFHSMTDTFVVHIVNAHHVDVHHFPAWELFLHLMRTKMELVIIMIGTALYYETFKHDVCSRCQANGNTLVFQSVPSLYHVYVSHRTFRRPNVVVGFQSQFYSEPGSETIMAIKSLSCPLVLTASTILDEQENIDMIRQVVNVEPVLRIENNLCSRRPYRDIRTIVCYRNIYLIVYNNLSNKRNK